MHTLTKNLNIESPGFKPCYRPSLIKYLPKHVLQARKSRYSKSLLTNPVPKITSYSPVSSSNYKDFSLMSLIERLPQKSKKRRVTHDQENLNRLQGDSSKLHTYAILPPVRRSADYLNDSEKSALVKARYFKYKKSLNQYRPKVFLPVLQQKPELPGSKGRVRIKLSDFSSASEEEDECKLNAWERSDSN